MKTEAKEIPINIRARASQRELIDRAAQLVSKSRTDFILDVACREAQDILLDQRLFFLDDEKYEYFLELLEEPLSENEGHRHLMSIKPRWE